MGQLTETAKRQETVQVDKDFTSDRLSSSSRYIGFGLAGVAFLIFSSDSQFASTFLQRLQPWLVLSAAFGCMTIIADYFHYMFGYGASSQAAKNEANGYKYDEKSFYYRGRKFFFWIKHILAVLGATVLIVILLLYI